MPRVLIVDDDSTSLDILNRLLGLDGHDVRSAGTGKHALSLAARWEPHAALIELRLPDMSGLEVLRGLRTHGVACAIVTSFGTCRSAVEAMKTGAADVVEKPIIGDDVLGLVERLTAQPGVGSDAAVEFDSHALQRWTNLIVKAIPLRADPRTLSEWGHAIGVSEGALRNWCRTAGISARRSLLFARVLRAVACHERTGTAAEALLNVVDRRTVNKILSQCGGVRGCLPSSLSLFLDHQLLVPPEYASEMAKCLQLRYSQVRCNQKRGGAESLRVTSAGCETR
jgi:ActR/RegA family two-component response regulator